MSIADVTTRQQAIDYLDGYATARRDELAGGRLTAGLVKSYLLETGPSGQTPPDLETIFAASRARLVQIDDSLWKVWADGVAPQSEAAKSSGETSRWFGFVEQLIPRHPVLYTTDRVDHADSWVRHLVQHAAALDHVWLSGITFYQLWRRISETNSPQRIGKIGFAFESVFDVDVDAPIDGEEDGSVDPIDGNPPDDPFGDIVSGSDPPLGDARRVSRFVMTDRIGRMRDALDQMRRIYDPLQSISMLRFPAPTRSGHDFYANGKATNRSGSFADHRTHVEYVLRMYKAVTEETERMAWRAAHEQRQTPALRLGAPVVIRFLGPSGEPAALDSNVFDQWISSTFGRKNNRFRLWGRPIRLGPGKVHVYGADRHLWQPITLELTRNHAIAFLPRGTCGNTIHRLVTNIQRYVSPNVSVAIGDQQFDDVIDRAMSGAFAQC